MTVAEWFATFQEFAVVVVGPLAFAAAVLLVVAAMFTAILYFIHIRM